MIDEKQTAQLKLGTTNQSCMESRSHPELVLKVVLVHVVQVEGTPEEREEKLKRIQEKLVSKMLGVGTRLGHIWILLGRPFCGLNVLIKDPGSVSLSW